MEGEMKRITTMPGSRRVIVVVGLSFAMVLIAIVAFSGDSTTDATIAAGATTTVAATEAQGSPTHSSDGTETTTGDSIVTSEATEAEPASQDTMTTVDESSSTTEGAIPDDTTGTTGGPDNTTDTTEGEDDEPDTPDPTTVDTTEPSTPTTSEVALEAQTVTWDWVVEDKQWGDADVTVSATASSGGPISYSTGGDECSVGSTSGVVSIDNVGTCSVVATQPGTSTHESASALLTFDIAKATPVISFSSGSVNFARGNPVFSLWATSDPPIPIRYEMTTSDDTLYDSVCAIVDGTRLQLADLVNGSHPPLSATCAIRASAASTSSNYSTPTAVTASVDIFSPSRSLSSSVGTTTPAAGADVSITFLSPEANIYAVDVDTVGPCTSSFQAAPTYPSPVGTEKYTAAVTINADADVGEVCEVYGTANPTDHSGTVYSTYDELTVSLQRAGSPSLFVEMLAAATQ
jgi:hypothetical protein